MAIRKKTSLGFQKWPYFCSWCHFWGSCGLLNMGTLFWIPCMRTGLGSIFVPSVILGKSNSKGQTGLDQIDPRSSLSLKKGRKKKKKKIYHYLYVETWTSNVQMCTPFIFVLPFCSLAAVLLFIPFPNNFVSRYITGLEASWGSLVKER